MIVAAEQNILQLLSADELREAWEWLLSQIQVRPTNPGTICCFDNKSWGDDPALPDFEDLSGRICQMLGRLYIASQFGNHRDLIWMAHGRQPQIVILPIGNLDHDIRAVITSAPRFRNHLSEHLSYWIRLAIEKKQRGLNYQADQKIFACSRPNIQPEDKGPDGLYLEVSPEYRVEILSVKNSIGNPRSLVASPRFRNSGRATPKKLLDDFWLLHHQNDGLLRLEDLLDRTLGVLEVSPSQQLRLGLIKAGSWNAVVVADTQYADETLFQGYEHITPDIARRIATYIGAVNWRTLAARTNRVVIQVLESQGLL